MSTLLTPTSDLLESDPEVKSYIYQQILDFQPYVTPETIVAVIAKDPMKLASQLEAEDPNFDTESLAQQFRISITLSEGDTKLEAEALSPDIFEAIRLAKQALLQRLGEIHDSIVSHQDRISEINQYLAQGNNTIH